MTTQSEPIGIKPTDIKVTRQTQYWGTVEGLTVKGKNWVIQNMSRPFMDVQVIQTEFMDELIQDMEREGMKVERR